MIDTPRPADSPIDASQAPAAGERVKLRGRPRKEHSGAIDADILKAAIELFDEVGYDNAAMEAIAVRAGISKRTLYIRYPDKKALFKHVIASIVARARHPDPPQFSDMRSCLEFHVENFFMICDDPGMRVLLAMGDKSTLNRHELGFMGQELTYELGVVNIVETIKTTAEKSGTKIDEPEFYAAALLDLAMGHFQRFRALGSTYGTPSTAVVSKRIVNLLLAGMQADCANP